MTKLLIFGINFHPELSGIGVYTGDLVAYLAAQDHDVRVVTAPPYYPQWRVHERYRWWKYQEEVWKGARVYRSPIWVPRRPTGLRRVLHLSSFALSSLPAMLAQVRWRPQVVMAIAPAILSAPNALILARIVGARSWLHIQDFELEAAQRLGILAKLGPVAEMGRKVERALIGRFDRVSTISESMLKRLRALGLPEARLGLLPNWVDPHGIRPSTPNRLPFDLPEDATVLLYSGNMGRKQGLGLLIETAQLLEKDAPNIVMVLCGDGPELAALNQSAVGLKNVRFLDLQPAERLNELLNTADIHLLPQRAEASDLVMPSKLLGMMASGRPSVIAAPVGSELARMAVQAGVRVPTGDPKAMADAIVLLARNPDQRKRLGESARAYILKNRSRNAVLAGFEAELKSLVASGSRRRPSQASGE